MAKTYYGYKKRDGLQAVDYLGATKDLTEGLTGIFEEREKERGLIEEEIREAEKQTKDVPMGDSGTLNQFALEGSNNAAEALRTQTYLLRNSKIRPSEFTKFRQNVMDGMVDLKEGAVSLNKNISETAAAVEAGTASVAQAKFLEDAMQDTWFDRTRMYTDPKSGHMMIVRTDEKGKDIKGSENSVRNFKNQTKQIIARYDIEKETSSFTKTLGEDIRLSMKSGVKTVKDALSKKTIDPVTKKEYTGFDLVNKYVDGASDADLASILVDELGGNYSPTGDVNDKGKAGMVYYEADPTAVNKNSRVPKLTPEQKDAAREYLRANIYAQIDYTETAAATTGGKTSDYDKKETKRIGDEKEQAGSYVDALKMLFLAKDKPERERAMRMLGESIGQDRFSSMEMNAAGDAMTLTTIDDDGKARPRVIKFDGTLRDFIETAGPTLTGLKKEDAATRWKYIDEVLDEDSGNKIATTHQGSYDIGYVFGPKKQELMDYTDSAANIDRLIKGVKQGWLTSEGTAFQMYEDAVNSALSGMGAEGVVVVRSGSNLSIKLPEGKVVDITLNESSETKSKVKNILKAIHTALSKGDEAALDRLITAEGGASQFNT